MSVVPKSPSINSEDLESENEMKANEDIKHFVHKIVITTDSDIRTEFEETIREISSKI